MTRLKAFTLIELLVVMAIIGTLLSLVTPRYFRSLQHANETALQHDLSVMREAIGNFRNDLNRYPNNLNELVSKGYLKSMPVDPITGASDSWVVIPPADPKQGGVYDIVSGSDQSAIDGTPFNRY